MPQVFILAAVGAAAYAGYRALARFGEQLAANMRHGEDVVREQAAAAKHKDGGTLEYDPASGVYTIAKR